MGMQVPSGGWLDDYDLELLKDMVRYGFIRWDEKPIRLKSGVESHVYVYGREDVTDNILFEGEIGWKIAAVVTKTMENLKDVRRPCLIGVPVAGTVFAQAASMMSWGGKRLGSLLPAPGGISHRVMREVLKTHGAHQDWVNGRPDTARHCYWLVDNVVTDGQSKIEAAEKLAEDGYPVKEMPCLIFVDREQGAVKRLERHGFRHIIVVYNLLDLTYAFGELNLWPKSAVLSVEEEIRAHQLL